MKPCKILIKILIDKVQGLLVHLMHLMVLINGLRIQGCFIAIRAI